jgi:two-component system OmpR family response regulator
VSRRHRVLIVEDEAELVEFYKTSLGTSFDFEDVRDLDGVYKRLSHEPLVDALILDLSLPNGAGIAVINIMQAKYPNVPIVVVTGLNSPDEEACIKAGAQEYLAKPVKQKQLMDRIARAIARHSVRPLYRPLEKETREAKEMASTREQVLAGILHETPPGMRHHRETPSADVFDKKE